MIPEKKLELAVDVNRLTLSEITLFDPAEVGIGTFTGLRNFIVKYSNWTPEEVGAIELGELPQVSAAIGEALQKQAVPLATSMPSRSGRVPKKARPPG